MKCMLVASKARSSKGGLECSEVCPIVRERVVRSFVSYIFVHYMAGALLSTRDRHSFREPGQGRALWGHNI